MHRRGPALRRGSSTTAMSPKRRMSRPQRVSQVLSLLLLSCGGRSEDNEEGGSGNAGTGGTHFSLSTGGTPDVDAPAAGGLGDASDEEQCPASTGTCVRDCFDQCIAEIPTCSNGTSHCPGDAILLSSCPERACCATPTHCCDTTTGTIAANPCDEDGGRPLCPVGTQGTGRHRCLPGLLEGEDCSVLEGQPCDDAALKCQSFVRLETYCRCEGDGDAAVWSCAYSTGP